MLYLSSYATYAGSVIDTYDSVVGNTLSLLNSVSLDERARRYKADQLAREVHYICIYLSYS